MFVKKVKCKKTISLTERGTTMPHQYTKHICCKLKSYELQATSCDNNKKKKKNPYSWNEPSFPPLINRMTGDFGISEQPTMKWANDNLVRHLSPLCNKNQTIYFVVVVLLLSFTEHDWNF